VLRTPLSLPEEYFSEYEKLLADLSGAKPNEIFGRNANSNWATLCHSAFVPECGSAYKQERDLLLVGRATNGWDNGWLFSGLADNPPQIRPDRQVEKETIDAWLVRCWHKSAQNKYSLCRSYFWKATKAVLGALWEDDEPWASRLAWTNLYKIAPTKSGNPSERLCSYQLRRCVKLLELELEMLNPRYVLLVTGHWCEPFIKEFKFSDDVIVPHGERSCILRTARWNQQKWVFTTRPDTRPPVDPSMFAKQVVAELDRN